jgi:hypothetical protein
LGLSKSVGFVGVGKPVPDLGWLGRLSNGVPGIGSPGADSPGATGAACLTAGVNKVDEAARAGVLYANRQRQRTGKAVNRFIGLLCLKLCLIFLANVITPHLD